MDAKASVKLGSFSRGGYGRVGLAAADHDFGSEGSLTPFSILLPQYGDLCISFAESKVTSDYIWDRVEEQWPEWEAKYRPSTLVINQDNGPENSSSRTQFIKRAVDFANQHGINIQLAYYPPYHSKYNPVERARTILEWDVANRCGNHQDCTEHDMEGRTSSRDTDNSDLPKWSQIDKEGYGCLRKGDQPKAGARRLVCQYQPISNIVSDV